MMWISEAFIHLGLSSFCIFFFHDIVKSTIALDPSAREESRSFIWTSQ